MPDLQDNLLYKDIEPVEPKKEDYNIGCDFFVSIQPLCPIIILILIFFIAAFFKAGFYVIGILLIILLFFYFKKIIEVGNYLSAFYHYKYDKRDWDKKMYKILKERQHGSFTFDEIIEKNNCTGEQLEFFKAHNEYEHKIAKMILIMQDRLGDDFKLLNKREIAKLNRIKHIDSIKIPIDDKKQFSEEEISALESSNFFADITKIVEAKKSGQKGKLAFLNSKGELSTTEHIVKEYLEKEGYNVIRAEVNLWQALFGIVFFEEIYSKNWDIFNDIPYDLYTGEHFYRIRKKVIDKKYEFIKKINILEFVNDQIKHFSFFSSRLLYNRTKVDIEYCKTQKVQDFLSRVDATVFANIIYRIAQNVNDNRAGLPDYIAFNNRDIIFVEVKRAKEKIRDTQINWISFLKNNSVPVYIYRVKGV